MKTQSKYTSRKFIGYIQQSILGWLLLGGMVYVGMPVTAPILLVVLSFEAMLFAVYVGGNVWMAYKQGLLGNFNTNPQPIPTATNYHMGVDPAAPLQGRRYGHVMADDEVSTPRASNDVATNNIYEHVLRDNLFRYSGTPWHGTTGTALPRATATDVLAQMQESPTQPPEIQPQRDAVEPRQLP
jgi:hypothetical protein